MTRHIVTDVVKLNTQAHGYHENKKIVAGSLIEILAKPNSTNL